MEINIYFEPNAYKVKVKHVTKCDALFHKIHCYLPNISSVIIFLYPYTHMVQNSSMCIVLVTVVCNQVNAIT